ncbi:flagellar basal body rod protein FlgC [Butyricicoccus faecihominis]|uniref:flagellar basal body rod protein FlgC n=1 Tax=Butyricicoccus faecihominis TaxID=1712515 RepID=UPI002478BB8D|nr:flagellar basal body rod protein FlgC [Butyricicoccus faecihominis]
MGFLGSMDIVGSALTAERYRTDVIAQNLANYKTTVTEDGEPYRRKQVVLEERPMTFGDALETAGQAYRATAGTSGGVRVAEVVESDRDFRLVYDPSHPQADANGYVSYPNVDTTEEMIDLMAASNAYDTNLTALGVIKAMVNKTLELSK